jgi:hypothetical protein
MVRNCILIAVLDAYIRMDYGWWGWIRSKLLQIAKPSNLLLLLPYLYLVKL